MKRLFQRVKEKQIIVPHARVIRMAIDVVNLFTLALGDAIERVLRVVKAKTAENDDTIAMFPTAVFISRSVFDSIESVC